MSLKYLLGNKGEFEEAYEGLMESLKTVFPAARMPQEPPEYLKSVTGGIIGYSGNLSGMKGIGKEDLGIKLETKLRIALHAKTLVEITGEGLSNEACESIDFAVMDYAERNKYEIKKF